VNDIPTERLVIMCESCEDMTAVADDIEFVDATEYLPGIIDATYVCACGWSRRTVTPMEPS
jgi:hypothetical protein